MDRMATETIERPDLDEWSDTKTDERPDADATDRGDDDRPKFFHYVKKDRIAESAVMGNHVVALCGETFPVTRSAKPGSPVCPKCKKIYNRMRKD
ncbi:hypothetical protein GOOTI_204_00410 [Gordonia otitidis NBRC 100426]|uniref:DUF3039 domain-containing protein n=2 Tax=Gordonia otitidis TaxID=249058 RepID=H5TS05_GORO1|nr:hypothetical protein GOOTI_204_00410 [Gordonia otitidis NBRC 100426]